MKTLAFALIVVQLGCQSVRPVSESSNAPGFLHNHYKLQGADYANDKVRGVPQECVGFWRSLTEVDADNVVSRLNNTQWHPPADCEAWTQKVTSLNQRFCHDLVTERMQADGQCVWWTIVQRAALIDRLNRDQKPLSDMASEALINRFVVNTYASAFRQRPDLSRIAQDEIVISTELLRRYPKVLWLEKLDCFARFLLYQSEKPSPKPETVAGLQSSLSKARASSPDDESVANMQLSVYRDQNQTSEYSRLVGEVVRKNPKSEVGRYHLARIKWLNNKKTEALRLLQSLQADEPSNALFESIISRLDAVPPRSDIFAPLDIHFEFE